MKAAPSITNTMRDRNFYINSIKMDLFRVVTASGDLSKPPATLSIKEFLEHAINDFNKFSGTSHDNAIRSKLQQLYNDMYRLEDFNHRLRWVEEVLTARCRLY
uniref:Uncharacterized protein n=1 Tax=candidate division WWE3 bacterium TaxID=2053526 RepID=A0A7C4XTT7_UNCKA